MATSSSRAVEITDTGFPADFAWGTATAAYQIEGGVREGGRGESIWDRYSHTPGKIRDGSNGDVACDSYTRWREDLDLIQRLSYNAYRFSVAWPRVYPEGRGRLNEQGLDYYDSLVDGLLARGIQPFVTLYHWDCRRHLKTLVAGSTAIPLTISLISRTRWHSGSGTVREAVDQGLDVERRQERHEDGRAAGDERRQQLEEEDVEGERRHDGAGVAGAPAELVAARREQVGEAAVLDGDALRPPGRSRGVDHVGEVGGRRQSRALRRGGHRKLRAPPWRRPPRDRPRRRGLIAR